MLALSHGTEVFVKFDAANAAYKLLRCPLQLLERTFHFFMAADFVSHGGSRRIHRAMFISWSSNMPFVQHIAYSYVFFKG